MFIVLSVDVVLLLIMVTLKVLSHIPYLALFHFSLSNYEQLYASMLMGGSHVSGQLVPLRESPDIIILHLLIISPILCNCLSNK